MKTIILTSIFGILSLTAFTQNKKYTDAMKKNLLILDSAKKSEDFTKAANGFERIALSEKKDWLSNYYTGMCYILMAYGKGNTDIDIWCDKADSFINKADSLSKNNAEVYVLKAMSASARIMVDPMKRGYQYGSLSNDFTEKAILINADNPRAYLTKGQGIFYTPENFGGGTKRAKPLFEKSVEKYNVFKPESELHPNWGKSRAESFLKKCNES